MLCLISISSSSSFPLSSVKTNIFPTLFLIAAFKATGERSNADTSFFECLDPDSVDAAYKFVRSKYTYSLEILQLILFQQNKCRNIQLTQ